jgi:lambda family phage portal protein
VVPDGYEFRDWNPNYPDAQVEPFLKSCLRGMASGLGVAYHSLANNLEAVNFSSARSGLIEEQANWMLIQEWMIDHLHVPLYRRWLKMADLTGRLTLQGSQTKYYDVTFMPKRWPWVDPLKDVQANIEAIKWGLKSRTQVVSETGGDVEDIFAQLRAEEDLAEQFDVEINPDEAKAEAMAEAKPEPAADSGGQDEQSGDE